MTISTTTIKNSYNGNGSTSAFNYTFKISAESEMQVIIRSAAGTETVKTLTTHYTITGVGNAGGGAVTFTAGNIPVTGETVILRRVTAQTQAMDLIDNDPMSADTIENAHDKSIAIAQELQEQIDRSIKLSRTNTMTSTEFTVDAASRANKILAFDSAGEIAVTQELGTYKGNWAASTSYQVRDIVKDTSTNNIFIALTAHTSSGTQPLTTNTDSAKWSLLVDAASATTSQNAAAASATAASNSQTAAASSAAAALVSENASATSETNSASSATASANSATASASSATAAAGSASAAAATFDLFDDAYLGAKASNPTLDNDGDALQDGALYFDTTNDVMKVYDLGTTSWLQLTPTVSNQNNINAVNSNSANINTVASDLSGSNNIGAVAGNATNINTVAGLNTEISNLGTSGTVASINTVANNLADINAFANIYLGPSGSAPSQDPDGSALDVGDLYFDTTSDTLKVYKSGGWAAAGSTVNGTSKRYIYNITGTPTTLTGASGTGYAEATSQILSYDAGFVDIFHNGVKMILGTDVTATSGTSLVFASALANGDVVDVVAYGTFELANIQANDLTDVSTAGVSDGQVLVYNSSNSRFQPGNASSAEVYGFNKNASGQLIITTTNEGADNIDSSTFASFDDVLFSASGFTFSISNGNLIATI